MFWGCPLWAFPWVSVDEREYERELQRSQFIWQRWLIIQLLSLPAQECRVADALVTWSNDELAQEGGGQLLEPRVSPPVLEGL